ncbi:MAG: BMP family protein [Bacillota bacterium]
MLRGLHRFVAVAAIIVMAGALLAGCQPKKPQTFKVAGLFPGPITDGGWSSTGYGVLKHLEKELGAEVAYMENVAPGDMREALRDFAKRGFNFIYGHSFEFQDPIMDVAKEYPKVFFSSSGGLKFAANYFPMELCGEQAAYVQGIIAAMLSKTGRAGMIGSKNIPSIHKTFVGFRAGAQSVNPSFRVDITYVGAHDDVSGGYEAAMAHINNGADFLFENANATGLGAIQAAKEKGVYIFAGMADKTHLAPEAVLANNMIHINAAYLLLAKNVKEGKLGTPGVAFMGFAQNAVELRWNPALKAKVPANVLAAAEKAIEDIKAGKIRVPTKD